MPKKNKSIPVNTMVNEPDHGIAIEKITFSDLSMPNLADLDSDEAKQSHRHDSHSFFLLENGTVSIEIDFQSYSIEAPSVIYMHPDQVHRTSAFQNVTVSSWAINNENLNTEYLNLLEDITPAKPLPLNQETFSVFSDAVTLCLKFSEWKNDKLYHSLLKDSCNALVALVISQYLKTTTPTDKLSRFEIVTRAFRKSLEHNFITTKQPTAYAEKLNISTAYLNECVKNTTGFSVSYHIQQRVILEAKRSLYHSETSVKEIATQLGYDDYPYFARLFTKVAGMTALSFRNKNHD